MNNTDNYKILRLKGLHMSKLQTFAQFFEMMNTMDADTMTALVEKHLSDEELEYFVRHLEDFYGIEEEEELGNLAQIMVTGYLAAKSEQGQLQ
jgi:hypothetical protein